MKLRVGVEMGVGSWFDDDLGKVIGNRIFNLIMVGFEAGGGSLMCKI